MATALHRSKDTTNGEVGRSVSTMKASGNHNKRDVSQGRYDFERALNKTKIKVSQSSENDQIEEHAPVTAQVGGAPFGLPFLTDGDAPIGTLSGQQLTPISAQTAMGDSPVGLLNCAEPNDGELNKWSLQITENALPVQSVDVERMSNGAIRATLVKRDMAGGQLGHCSGQIDASIRKLRQRLVNCGAEVDEIFEPTNALNKSGGGGSSKTDTNQSPQSDH